MINCVGLPKSFLTKVVDMAGYEVNSSPSLITSIKVSGDVCDKKIV